MDDLRERLNLAIAGTAEARCADDGDGYVDVWVTNIEETADAVLAEIGKTHVLIQKHDARIKWADTLLLRDEDGADTR
jgi:hypothetical protein